MYVNNCKHFYIYIYIHDLSENVSHQIPLCPPAEATLRTAAGATTWACASARRRFTASPAKRSTAARSTGMICRDEDEEIGGGGMPQ